MGRILGKFISGRFPGHNDALSAQHTYTYNALTGQMMMDQAVSANDGKNQTDNSRYVYNPNGAILCRTTSSSNPDNSTQTLYALTNPAGSVIAITDDAGTVVERYVYDALGNAQALQANGQPYPVQVYGSPDKDANWLLHEQFSGTLFDTTTQLQSTDGTHYAWDIFQNGMIYDAVPGLYQAASGQMFSPRQQSLLSPNLSVLNTGRSPYDQSQGGSYKIWGFISTPDSWAMPLAATSSIGVGIGVSILTAGIATPLLAAEGATTLTIGGTVAVEAIAGFTGVTTTSGLISYGNGNSASQITYDSMYGGIFGAVTGGTFGVVRYAAYGGTAVRPFLSLGAAAARTARIAAIREALTDANGSLLTQAERYGIKQTIRRIEDLGYTLQGTGKYGGNRGIDLLFGGIGENEGRIALAEAKAGWGLGDLAVDSRGIRQGSKAFFRTRALAAGRMDIVDAIRAGQANYYAGFGASGKLYELNFPRNINFRTNPNVATEIFLR